MEREAASGGKLFTDMSAEELDALWRKAKQAEGGE